jgi:hypothetical protein
MAAKIYKNRRLIKLVIRVVIWLITVLLALLIAVFFIFKSWTV